MDTISIVDHVTSPAISFTRWSPHVEGFAAVCAVFGVKSARLFFEGIDSGLFGEVLFENNNLTIRELSSAERSALKPDSCGRFVVDAVAFNNRVAAAHFLLQKKPFNPLFEFSPQLEQSYVDCYNAFSRVAARLQALRAALGQGLG